MVLIVCLFSLPASLGPANPRWVLVDYGSPPLTRPGIYKAVPFSLQQMAHTEVKTSRHGQVGLSQRQQDPSDGHYLGVDQEANIKQVSASGVR